MELETLTVDGKTFSLDHQYDSLGLLSGQVYPSGRTVSYAPNALGQASKAGGYITQTGYFPGGQLSLLGYGNGLVQRYTLNSNDMVEDLTLSNYSGNGYLLNYRHSYDRNLNVERIEDKLTASATISLGYDGLDRLTSANGYWGTGRFSYDVLGNLTSKLLGSQSLSYQYDNSNNRLTSVSGAAPYSFSYDDRGNVTHNGKYSLSFNRANQVTAANGNSYLYDGHNRRVKKTNNSGSEYSFYSQSGRLYSTQQAGENTDYIYLGNQLVAKDNGAVSGGSTGSAPAVPTGLNLSLSGSTLVAKWSAVSTATSYKIQWAINGSWQAESSLSNVTTSNFAGAAGNSYQFRVKACNGRGCSNASLASSVIAIAGLSAPVLVWNSDICDKWESCNSVTWLLRTNESSGQYVFEFKKSESSTWTSQVQASSLFTFGTREKATYQFRAKLCSADGHCTAYSNTENYSFNTGGGEDPCFGVKSAIACSKSL